MITEVNIYASLFLAAFAFGLAIRLGVALYRAN